MRRFKLILGIVLLACLFLFTGCEDDSSIPLSPAIKQIFSHFESGNIGWVDEKGWQNWDIYLKDDNGNPDLRDSYRNWWYIMLDDLWPNQPMTLTLKNRGWWYYYVPVFSYDQITWHYFNEDEITISDACDNGIEGCTLRISTDRFTESRVYIARTFPYTYEDLNNYLSGIESSPFVTITSLGQSHGFGEEIPLIRIEDTTVDDSAKRAVWIHARSHPGETGSSYLTEGIIDQLLEDLDLSLNAARKLVFFIAPMHNVDGVIEGNYRTDLLSQNLEIEWLPDDIQPLDLKPEAALENRLLNAKMKELATNPTYLTGMVALNLHSSNSPPDTMAFSYPHFGDDPATYNAQEISLWKKSTYLVDLIDQYYGGYFSPPPAEGGSGFLNYPFPEAWWWNNMADDCLAMTIETVYSKAGFNHWISQDDIRRLGASVTLALYDYAADPNANGRRSLIIEDEEQTNIPDEIENKL